MAINHGDAGIGHFVEEVDRRFKKADDERREYLNEKTRPQKLCPCGDPAALEADWCRPCAISPERRSQWWPR